MTVRFRTMSGLEPGPAAASARWSAPPQAPESRWAFRWPGVCGRPWVCPPGGGPPSVRLSDRGRGCPEVRPAAGAAALQQVSLVNYDRQWATDNKDRIIKKWQAAVGI